MKPIQPLFKIADIHADRLKLAIENIQNKIPISGESISNLSQQDLLFFELFSSRFSKLQDYMGSQLFPAILELAGEPAEEMTFIDKLNKLEKIKLISNAAEWMEMRQIRNHLSHEYPDKPGLHAEHFNKAFELAHSLLLCLENLKIFIKTQS